MMMCINHWWWTQTGNNLSSNDEDSNEQSIAAVNNIAVDVIFQCMALSEHDKTNIELALSNLVQHVGQGWRYKDPNDEDKDSPDHIVLLGNGIKFPQFMTKATSLCGTPPSRVQEWATVNKFVPFMIAANKQED